MVANKSKKIYFFIFLFFTLSACAKSEQNKAVLDIFAYGNTATPDGRASQRVIEQFIELKGLTPDQYTVEYLYDDAYHEKAQAKLYSGDAPDIMYAWASERASYLYRSGQAIDLRTVLDMDRYQEKAIVPLSPISDFPEGVYVLPQSIGVNSILYTNMQLLETLGLSLPTTYDDLLSMLEPVQSAGYTLITMANQAQWVMNSTLFGTLVAKTSGDPNWLRKARRGEYSFTDQPFVDALKMVETMYKDGVLTRQNIETDYGTAISQFTSGNALFMIDGHWRVAAIEDTEFLNHISMIPFPTIPGDKLPNSAAGEPAPGYTITKAALENESIKELALEFLNYISGPEGAKVFQEEASFIPILKEPVDANITPQLKLKMALYDQVETLANTPDQIMDTPTSTALNNGLQEIGLGVLTAEEVAQNVENAAVR